MVNSITMKCKLLSLLFLCLLFSSCEKALDGPHADYRLEVSCNNCVISIANGNSIQSYDVYGYRSIPFNHWLPVITVSLWTDDDVDDTIVKFKGSGYNNILFDGYLYYNDPAKIIEFNL